MTLSALSPSLLLLLNAAATLFMTGLIWFVQVVHYPLFGSVGDGGFDRYAALHARRTTWVVGPPMLLELVTSFGLVFRLPAGTYSIQAWSGSGPCGRDLVFHAHAANPAPQPFGQRLRSCGASRPCDYQLAAHGCVERAGRSGIVDAGASAQGLSKKQEAGGHEDKRTTGK